MFHIFNQIFSAENSSLASISKRMYNSLCFRQLFPILRCLNSINQDFKIISIFLFIILIVLSERWHRFFPYCHVESFNQSMVDMFNDDYGIRTAKWICSIQSDSYSKYNEVSWYSIFYFEKKKKNKTYSTMNSIFTLSGVMNFYILMLCVSWIVRLAIVIILLNRHKNSCNA